MTVWQPISTAPRDSSRVVLVWDGEALFYPIAARWRYDVIRRPARGVRKDKQEIIACGFGEWVAVEDDLRAAIESGGGLRPTHWLPWEPPPVSPAQ
jgi:hypothetical protein